MRPGSRVHTGQGQLLGAPREVVDVEGLRVRRPDGIRDRPSEGEVPQLLLEDDLMVGRGVGPGGIGIGRCSLQVPGKLENVEDGLRNDGVARQRVGTRVVLRPAGGGRDVVHELHAPLVGTHHGETAGVRRPGHLWASGSVAAQLTRAGCTAPVREILLAVVGEADRVASPEASQVEVVTLHEHLQGRVRRNDERPIVGQRVHHGAVIPV